MSKADEATAPTEEQIKAANEAEEAKWQGDFDPESLKIPYKREEQDDKDKPRVEDKSPDTTTKAARSEYIVEPDQYSEPAPLVTVEDPGDYKPADYSFEIEIKGKTHKVDSAEKAAELADEFAEDLTAKQIVALMTKSTSIDRKQERDKEKWEANKKVFDDQVATATQRQETVDTFAAEFDYLVNKGLMPKINPEHLNADWNDPEISKQPGVKEQIELLNYMVKENEARIKARVKPLTSVVDAYNAWQQDSGRQKKEADARAVEDAERAAGEARKVAGAKVAGVSPSQQGSYVPKGIAVGNPNILKRGAAQWDD